MGRLGDTAVGRDAVGDPDVSADDGTSADGDITEDGGTRVDDDFVFEVGVSFDAFDGVAVFVEGETFCAEGDTLIEADALSDDSGFTDDNACSVIDKQPFGDRGPGMDIDTCQGVGAFGDHAGQDGDAHLIELVGDTLVCDGEESGITEDHFIAGQGGGIADVGGVDIRAKKAPNGGELASKTPC